uniref:E3 ubiquitin-protein ligase n=1 Tax=Timema poppense TaxID=170557 RepID=A0A7R9GXE4_TIMPO|nr:unnamed protein product [Timema poppensis]
MRIKLFAFTLSIGVGTVVPPIAKKDGESWTVIKSSSLNPPLAVIKSSSLNPPLDVIKSSSLNPPLAVFKSSSLNPPLAVIIKENKVRLVRTQDWGVERAEVAFYEILSGMWVRNGLQIKGQAMTYIQCNFCNSMVDADLYLLQVCATQIAPEIFLTTVLDKFHVSDWMSLASYGTGATFLDGEHDTPMLESCLTFLATLINIRTNLGMNDASLSRLEMVTLLCMGDKTHSQLIELMPERCGSAQSRDFEAVLAEILVTDNETTDTQLLEKESLHKDVEISPNALEDDETFHGFEVNDDPMLDVGERQAHQGATGTKSNMLAKRGPDRPKLPRTGKRDHPTKIYQPAANRANQNLALNNYPPYVIPQKVADYKAPNLEASGNMQQGMYVPKSTVWEELYDPIHVLLRAVHRRDFQTSMDRFTEYVQQAGKLKGNGTPWPPFRSPAPCSPAYDDPRKLLCSRVFHAMVFVVLHKAVHGHSVSEHVIALVLYLLEMAVATAEPFDHQTQVCQTSWSEPTEIRDKDLSTWYKSDWLSANVRTVINVVKIEQEPAVVFDSPDSDAEWESSEMEGEMSDVGVSSNALMLEGADVMEDSSQALVVGGGHHEEEEEGIEGVLAIEAGVLALEGVTHQPLALEAGPSSSVEGMGGEMLALDVVAHQHTGSISDQSVSVPNSHYDTAVMPTNTLPTVYSSYGPSTSQTISSNIIMPAMPLVVATGPAGSAGDVAPVSCSPFPRQPHKLKKRRQVTSGFPFQPDTVEVNESIISLLLKLHSHLSAVPDSYTPVETDGSTSSNNNNNSCDSIGDGPHFVARLLQRIASLDSLCRDNIHETRNRLWPRKQEECEEEQKEREAKEREERRKKAKDRQQKLMAEFASKQKQFMEKAMETDEEGLSSMDWNEDESSTLLASKKEYDCVICNQTTPSTEDKPMGLVVLVQSTSILGHKRRGSEHMELPTSDEERLSLRRDNTLGSEYERRMEDYSRYFDHASWLVSINLGWDPGVHLQTCGHHLHLDCLKSYLLSLRSQQRQQSIAVDRGEYWCPLCRQLANSVLPLSPQLGESAAMVRSRPASLPSMVGELTNFLKENPPNTVQSSLSEAMVKAMEDMTNSVQHKYKNKPWATTHQSQSLFQFVSSIARSNLEVELVQRGGSLCTCPGVGLDLPPSLIPKRSCIVPLLHVLAMHGRLLACWTAWRSWQDVSGVCEPGGPPTSLTPLEKEVPILLRDPSALLTQFILLLPLHLDQTYFSSVVKVLYNLLYFQVLVQLSCHMAESERSHWRNKVVGVDSLEAAMAMIVHHLEQSQLYQLYMEEDEASNSLPSTKGKDLDIQVQRLCLPFLRIASLLRHHLYDQPLPEVTTPQSEFVRLVYYLELVTEGMDWKRFNAAVALNWASDGSTLVASWCEQYAVFAYNSQVAARNFLVDQHITWHQPRLLRLPQDYDKIFQYYHRRQCSQCHSVPRESSICLLCGTLVCLKENCCKQHNMCEAVQHSLDCGGGTSMYLVVTSSYIIVIRGKRACLWGSVYLDSFGEEDRELKRGKPLYLSTGRYQLLEQQWLAHRFDHTNKKWVWHRDALTKYGHVMREKEGEEVGIVEKELPRKSARAAVLVTRGIESMTTATKAQTKDDDALGRHDTQFGNSC